jgi:hypothetical protein
MNALQYSERREVHDAFAQTRPADAKLAREVAFSGEAVSRFEFTPHREGAQVVSDLHRGVHLLHSGWTVISWQQLRRYGNDATHPQAPSIDFTFRAVCWSMSW